MRDTRVNRIMNYIFSFALLALGGFTWWQGLQEEIEKAWRSSWEGSMVGSIKIGAAALWAGIQLGRWIAFKFEISKDTERKAGKSIARNDEKEKLCKRRLN